MSRPGQIDLLARIYSVDINYLRVVVYDLIECVSRTKTSKGQFFERISILHQNAALLIDFLLDGKI